MLTRFAHGRLLFRLASSRYARQFVLEGATLFTPWTGKPHRATRALDLLGFGGPRVSHAQSVFSDVLALDVHEDGVLFDRDTMAVDHAR